MNKTGLICNFECCPLGVELLEIVRSCLVLLVIFVFLKKENMIFLRKGLNCVQHYEEPGMG